MNTKFHRTRATSAETGKVMDGSVPITAFEDVHVKASIVKFNKPTKAEELLAQIPTSGLGTILPAKGDVDDIFPAACLLLLGFFGIFPWLFGAWYTLSPNVIAKSAGIGSIVLLIAGILASICFYISTGQYIFGV